MAQGKGGGGACGGWCALLVRLNHLTHRVMLIIAQLSILAMIVIVTMTVVLRYCFNTGLSWAEEVPRLLVTVFAFMACAIGVRDHMHVSVDAVYNRFPIGGKARRTMDVLTDVATLLCGVFMLVAGGQRTMKLFSLTGTMPITGISTAWQYLPIPVAGFVMTFDSLLFLTGVIRRDDLLYSEPEIDFTDEKAVEKLRKEGEGK
ncbi:MAG: TRAP transporter small permease [Christensenellales bacterium]|nr:TRAP transporter small permease [Christensenellales bacterium]